MKRSIFILFVLSLALASCNTTPEVNINLKYDDNISLQYDEVIDAYQQLADAYPEAQLTEYGKTDIGKPLHLFMMSLDKDFDPSSIRKKGRCIV